MIFLTFFWLNWSVKLNSTLEESRLKLVLHEVSVQFTLLLWQWINCPIIHCYYRVNTSTITSPLVSRSTLIVKHAVSVVFAGIVILSLRGAEELTIIVSSSFSLSKTDFYCSTFTSCIHLKLIICICLKCNCLFMLTIFLLIFFGEKVLLKAL